MINEECDFWFVSSRPLCLLVLVRTLSEGVSHCSCCSLIEEKVFQCYSMIFYYSSCTCVALFNWKRTSLAYFAALLILCGDVSPNPGPPESFLCGICALEVSNNDAAVCYDNCDHWIHVSCDPSLSLDNYHEMVSNPSTEPWFTVTRNLTTVYLNLLS